MTLATIGYESATQASVFKALNAAKVKLLVDVRAISSSRKPGFSKSLLAEGLSKEGIGYVHLRALGTPKEGRTAIHAGKPKEMARIYAKHMKTPEAQRDFASLLDLARSRKKLCLMCYEHDHTTCHRAILAERVHAELGVRVEHLTPDTSGLEQIVEIEARV